MNPLTIPTPAWLDDALCAQTDPALFFADDTADADRARTVCRACPVAAPCLQTALDDPTLQGIWAGTTQNQRKRMRREAA